MNKEKIQEIIDRHNKIIDYIDGLGSIKVPSRIIFKLMPVSHSIACEGMSIVQLARENGFEVVCNMQNGRITAE